MLIKYNSKTVRKIISYQFQGTFLPKSWLVTFCGRKERQEKSQILLPSEGDSHSSPQTCCWRDQWGSTQILFIFPSYRNYGNYAKKFFLKCLRKMIYIVSIYYFCTDTDHLWSIHPTVQTYEHNERPGLWCWPTGQAMWCLGAPSSKGPAQPSSGCAPEAVLQSHIGLV